MLFGGGVTRGGARRSIGWAKATVAAIVAKVDSMATDIRLRTIASHFIVGTDWLETSAVGLRERGEGGASRGSLMEALQVRGEFSGDAIFARPVRILRGIRQWLACCGRRAAFEADA